MPKQLIFAAIFFVLSASFTACQFKIGSNADARSNSAQANEKANTENTTAKKVEEQQEAEKLNAGSENQTSVSFNDQDLPRAADQIEKFVPPGWTIEETISGDLNGDSIADAAVKLIEKMPADADKGNPPSRNRTLLILLKNKDGAFELAATAKKLLQCTGCGGAFYGVAEAPAEVEISKGVLIIKQDSGSREVTETVFRFRYEPNSKKFALIGYDESTRDRATGETTSESTNYLTGVKINEIFQYNEKLDKDVKKQSRQTKIAPKRQYLEEIDNESFGGN